MARNAMRGLPQVRPSGPASDRWSGASSTAMIVVLIGLMILSGCEKPPTFSELIHGKKKEPPAPHPVAQAPKQTPPPIHIAKEPEKPKRAPQEVLAEFNSTPSQQRTNALLTELANVPEAADQITDLNLTRSGVNDAGLAVLPKFTHVEKLTLDACQYGSTTLANVAKMTSVTSLSINGGVPKEPTCDKGLALIKGMHQLTSLSLSSANVSPKGLAHIAEMTWLESLNVSHTRFNDDSLAILAPLVNLKDLNISFTSVDDDGFQHLLPFHELETLKIGTLPIMGTGLMELAKRGALPNLRSLSVSGDLSLDARGYQGIYLLRKTLETLDLGEAALTDDRFTKSISALTKLEKLLVHDNPGLTDASMIALPRLRKLKNLYFWKNPGIGDNALLQIAKVRSLERVEIDLTRCSESGVRKMKRGLKHCEVFFDSKKIE